MQTYYSTFITGLQEVVVEAFKNELNDVQVETVLDGLVIYSTGASFEKIKSIRFLNNTFYLLHLFSQDTNLSSEYFIKAILKNSKLLNNLQGGVVKNKKTFRVIASEENQLVTVDKNLLAKIETLFERKLHLGINRSKPDTEVWFLTRREGYGFVGIRITRTPNYEKLLHKGELRPELANLMCYLAELKLVDIVLDPFAGYGSIPIECAKSFLVKQVVAGEKDSIVFKMLQDRVSKIKPKIILGRWDALKISSLADNSVDKIITDPPWGFYGSTYVNLEQFYKDMLKEFIRVLKPNGLIVVLTAQKELFEKIIFDFSALELIKKYDILVSGKKAAIYKIKKCRVPGECDSNQL